MPKEFDPHSRCIGEADGLEYNSLADLIIGNPVNCKRNWSVSRLHESGAHPKGSASWKHYVWNHYTGYGRNLDAYAATSDAAALARRLPQGAEFFDPCRPEGAGSSHPVQAPADPVHAAD